MQVIAWILGEYGSNQPEAKVRTILNLLSQFSYGTFEHERTRAAILLALTKLHSAISFEENDYVQQIMNDYLYSRSLEVQQRLQHAMTAAAVFSSEHDSVEIV